LKLLASTLAIDTKYFRAPKHLRNDSNEGAIRCYL